MADSMTDAEELPHRSPNSRQTHLTESHAIHTVDDRECRQEISVSVPPHEILTFFKKLTSWYESDVSSREELFLFADVTEGGEVYVRDQQGGEWLCWVADEWIVSRGAAPQSQPQSDRDQDYLNSEEATINERVVKIIIAAITQTYEEPTKITQKYDRVQVESCS